MSLRVSQVTMLFFLAVLVVWPLCSYAKDGVKHIWKGKR